MLRLLREVNSFSRKECNGATTVVAVFVPLREIKIPSIHHIKI
jgi:hypothetical protein